jgi:hypothetical protein
MAFELIPSVLAMLVCDQIITEQGTNKKSLIGIFQRVQSPIFPVVIPRFGIYVKMVDVEGTIEFKLRIVKLDDETLLAEMAAPIKDQDPSHPTELAISLQNFQIPQPGKYEFQLYANDVYLHRATIDLVEWQAGGA